MFEPPKLTSPEEKVVFSGFQMHIHQVFGGFYTWNPKANHLSMVGYQWMMNPIFTKEMVGNHQTSIKINGCLGFQVFLYICKTSTLLKSRFESFANSLSITMLDGWDGSTIGEYRVSLVSISKASNVAGFGSTNCNLFTLSTLGFQPPLKQWVLI